eukprot:6208830-Pleurochrysis_carterae.AAC.3
MHSYPNYTRAACVLAERSRSAHQALDSPLAHGGRRPRAPPTQSRSACAPSPRACAATMLPDHGRWYHV